MSDRRNSTNKTSATTPAKSGSEPRLLSGGNPQIPKGQGDGPVQDYIAAMPGWKRGLGERLDDVIVRLLDRASQQAGLARERK